MIRLETFQPSDFEKLIAWIDNEELLVTIAGTDFTYPLTTEQLWKYFEDASSHSLSIIETQGGCIGHAELKKTGPRIYKIDKLVIGDTKNRGKGIGQLVIAALLRTAFGEHKASIVELNVFEWNLAGIRCYEKCGFQFNAEKHAIFRVGSREWTALNMTINKKEWINKNQSI
ncbi:GNAT family N-acetyltransferase [Ekhidna sp.]|uniref:GNAT family N-acetyltransferase n=1 Tax=Ekhidna sp. TaxID=2608089 RepID=UPI003B5B2AD6